jgi:HD superfamily phosphodiesterase
MVSFKDVKNDPSISEYIRKADQSLGALGFTEHSFAHVGRAVSICEYILSTLGFDQRDVEIAKIAAYMHDIGNLVNRVEHSQSGAIMAFRILDNMGMPADEISTIVTAIGNHDEGTGVPVNEIAAALILADKSDVRRSRVRNRDFASFDIHDRVNYSVTDSDLAINEAKDEITLCITIDTQYSSVMDYFEIFMARMILCRKAAERLGLRFRLVINGQTLL